MTVTTLNILGRGNQSLAPVSGTDLVPLGYLTTALAGCAPLTHLQTSATITDFSAAVLAVLAANGVPLSGSGSVSLLANGGLKTTGGLLGVDSGIVSLVGHTHLAANVTDFSAATLAVLAANGVPLSGSGGVSLLANGGLKTTGGLLGVDSGIVSLVGHTHLAANIVDFNAATAAWAAANGVPLSGSGSVNLLASGGLKTTGGLLGIDSGITSVVGHHHVVAALDDFASGVMNVLATNGVPVSGTGVALLPFGGLKFTGPLLGIDSGIVSEVGHHHLAADITNLASGVQTGLQNNLANSATVLVSGTGPFAFNVVAANQGGLLTTNAGLVVDLGPAHYQAAAGDHTHALLHTPVTLGAMSSLSGTLSGQQLSFELLPVVGGGLLVTPSGVQVDFSVVQLAGGSAGVTPLTPANTATILLGLAGNVLSGTVPLDPNPPGGTGGQIIAGVNGLRVALGSTGTTAAAGNHGHNVVTSGTDGFMAASDKVRLDGLVAGTALVRGLVTTATLGLAVDGAGNLSGTVLYNPAPVTTGQGALGNTSLGLHVLLGTTANVAAAGNHLHDSRYLQQSGALAANLTISGTLTMIGASLVAPANASGVAAWFNASVNGTNYKIPLYQ